MRRIAPIAPVYRERVVPADCATTQLVGIDEAREWLPSLARFHAAGVNLALWRRAPDPAIAREIAAWRPMLRDDLTAEELAADSDRDALARRLAAHDLDPAQAPHWIADMARLMGTMRALRASLGRATDPLRLRIETIDDDACRRFHVDRTRARLICTYRGNGTEWLTDAQVDRDALHAHSPNPAIVRHGAPQRIAPHWVALMKGECFPGNAGRGLVHRSPPYEPGDTSRLVFVLDL